MSTNPESIFDVVVVGAGAAGVGVAIALKEAGIDNFVVLEQHQIGTSFDWWPVETRFITPSFPTNSIGMLDLNSIAIGVSPGFSLQVEHPTGQDYAEHLRQVATFFDLPVREQVEVLSVYQEDEIFCVDTAEGRLRTKHVIWAAGEFQYPQQSRFTGSELCQHTAEIDSYEDLDGNDFIIIGGFESGMDAAYHLAYHHKRVRLFDRQCPWEAISSDPSIALSPFTLERMREDWFFEQVELFPHMLITSVTEQQGEYEVTAADGAVFTTDAPPLLAGGFAGSHRLIANLFELREDGFPYLNEQDESTIAPGLFLCGPSIRHDNHIFCFIYKFRQRFAVVAKAIASSLGLPAHELENYRAWGMYLDDLSACGEACVC